MQNTIDMDKLIGRKREWQGLKCGVNSAGIVSQVTGRDLFDNI